MRVKLTILATFVTLAVVVGARSTALGQSPAAKTGGPVPTFEADPTWPPALPNNWVMGDVASVDVDRRDHVWLLHRPRTVAAGARIEPAPPVLEFDASGKFIQGWGGPSDAFEWPDNEHGIYVDDKDVSGWRERRNRRESH